MLLCAQNPLCTIHAPHRGNEFKLLQPLPKPLPKRAAPRCSARLARVGGAPLRTTPCPPEAGKAGCREGKKFLMKWLTLRMLKLLAKQLVFSLIFT